MSDNAGQWLGQVIDGKFELRQFVGSSPDSWVFLTEREGQKAAIKLITADPQHADARILRLEQAKNLSHPNLMRVYETGRCRIGDAALVYAVMEYAEENLAEILTQRALTSTETGEMLPPLLDALAYLNGKGFAHGHLKPANILATGDQVKVSSDGICAPGEIPSQPSAYDAPESVTQGCSAAGDVWSLGMTLVETLTQQVPRPAQNATDDPALPSSLPQPFLDIARACVRRDPQRRSKITDIGARLRPSSSAPQTQASAPPHAAKAAAPTRPKPSPTNWRHAIPAAVLVLLALVVILVAPKVLNRLQGQSAGASAVEPAPPVAEKPASEPVSKPAPENEPSATSTATAAPMAAPGEPKASAKTPVEASRKAVASGEVIQQVMPNVPQKARDTIQGTVKVGVRVQVDAAGNVTDASLDSPGPSKYFANLAIGAARQWKFTPAAGGDSGAREWILRFQFTQQGTKATPVSTNARD